MHKIIQALCSAALLATLMISSALSCAAEPAWPFVFEGGRLVVKSSPEELSEAKSTLLLANEKNIPKSMMGGVLFDGEVLRQLPSDKFGQPVWQMKPAHFLLGREKVPGDTIVVVSPTIEAGGVVLHPGLKYRVFTIALEGRFYIWKAVVAKLEK